MTMMLGRGAAWREAANKRRHVRMVARREDFMWIWMVGDAGLAGQWDSREQEGDWDGGGAGADGVLARGLEQEEMEAMKGVVLGEYFFGGKPVCAEASFSEFAFNDCDPRQIHQFSVLAVQLNPPLPPFPPVKKATECVFLPAGDCRPNNSLVYSSVKRMRASLIFLRASSFPEISAVRSYCSQRCSRRGAFSTAILWKARACLKLPDSALLEP